MEREVEGHGIPSDPEDNNMTRKGIIDDLHSAGESIEERSAYGCVRLVFVPVAAGLRNISLRNPDP